MAAANIHALPPVTPASFDRRVVLVNSDDRARALLDRYLTVRGWAVLHVTNARQALRMWGPGMRAPFLVLHLEAEEPDSFELLAALAGHAIEVRVLVCSDVLSEEAAQSLGIERVLALRPRLSEIEEALEDLRMGCARRIAT
jgi:ActR/RegA family two-component response regulator